MIPGRIRAGWRQFLANAGAFALLAAGTQLIARQVPPWTSAWAAPWSGDVLLTVVDLLFLGLAFLAPLHGSVVNLGIYAQFLTGSLVASLVAANPSIDPAARVALALLAGAGAGAVVGAILLWLKWRFAVHEILSGLLLGGALVPLAHAIPTQALPLRPPSVLACAIILLVLGLLVTFVFGHFLRASAGGFNLRIVGSNPLAAVASGVNVDRVQFWMLAAGGACAGLTGGLELVTKPSMALARWPLPLAFAGITITIYGLGSLRGVLLASLLFAVWLQAPGTAVSLGDPGWRTAVAALLVIPVLWTLPRLLPDQGAPRAIWRTRHRDTY